MITWTPPVITGLMDVCRAYFATDAFGGARVQLVGDGIVGTNRMLVPAETGLWFFQSVVVYTSSSLVEQTTPVAISVNDA